MRFINKIIATGMMLIVSAMVNMSAHADDEGLMPYILGSSTTENVQSALEENGFEIAGSYMPYAGTEIIVVTNTELKNNAALSEHGGYGAAVRVSITQVGGQRQIAYNNPSYLANIYRMSGDLQAVKESLEAALGANAGFGAKSGVSVKRLRRFRYMMGMPGFKGPVTLAEYDSHAQALAAVNAGLAQGKLGASKVYRIDVPGKEESVFGVGLAEAAGDGGDAHTMSIIDQKDTRSSPHLCYEILVSGNKVYMLHGRFRIAQSFPSLTMGTFTKIMGAPGAIKQALREAANGAE